MHRIESPRITTVLSDVSDRICAALVMRSAKKYSGMLNTPDHFVEMLLLVEDKRFSVHFGIDPIAVVRASIFNLRGGILQGASTIAQQIYGIRRRRTLKLPLPRTIDIKLKQCAWALFHSVICSKASLLSEYVDSVYWGKSLYGLDNAAMAYFKTRRSSLSVAQSFFLAERLATPNHISVKRISTLLKRRAIKDVLLRRHTSVNDITLVYDTVYGHGGELWELLEK